MSGEPLPGGRAGTRLRHFQSATWRCNCLVACRSGHAIVIDACWAPDEVHAIQATVGAAETYLLITHADPDHICGVPLMPKATVVMGPRSAARVRDGSSAAELISEGRRWGHRFRGELRTDRLLDAGIDTEIGTFRVATVEARGHSTDGLAYLLPEEGIFAVGDYLSASMYPMVWWSVREARQTTERLLDRLAAEDIRTVVPGHGPLLEKDEALRIGEDDLRYLEALEQAADEAAGAGVPVRQGLRDVHGIEPPRRADADLEMLCPRMLNAAATFRDRGVDGALPWTLAV